MLSILLIYIPRKVGPLRKIHLDDLTLHMMQVERGTTFESDVNCDTKFMLETINEIGTAIRSKMKGSQKLTPFIFL